MKKIILIISMTALLIVFRGNKGLVIPGDNILIYKDIQSNEKVVRTGIVYDQFGKEVMRIPANTIEAVGSIDDSNIQLIPKEDM